MKKFLIIIVIMATPLAAMAQSISVSVNGLVCSFCATAIEKTFAKKGVNEVDVNLDEKYVKFDMPKGLNLSDEEITQTINDAGYDVTGIERGE